MDGQKRENMVECRERLNGEMEERWRWMDGRRKIGW